VLAHAARVRVSSAAAVAAATRRGALNTMRKPFSIEKLVFRL
jgi:hypothetical protein